MQSRALFLLPELLLYFKYFKLPLSRLLLVLCRIAHVLSRVVLVFCRVFSCCTRVISSCLVFYLCFAVLSRVITRVVF